MGRLLQSGSLGFDGEVDHSVIPELLTSSGYLLRPHLPDTCFWTQQDLGGARTPLWGCVAEQLTP